MTRDDELDLWGAAVPLGGLTRAEVAYLEALPSTRPSLEWLWREMDRVWDGLGLDNTRPLDGQPVAAFYNHPVWVANGAFTVTDPESQAHRRAIATWAVDRSPEAVADYGGGFGELALRIAEASPATRVSLIEPYPAPVLRHRLERAGLPVSLVPDVPRSSQDVVIAQDVLEHVEDPIGLAIEICERLRVGGTAVFANSFYPYIACHLPATFHLRRTFPAVMRALGLDSGGSVPGAEHALLFHRRGDLRVRRARAAEAVSRALVGVLRTVRGSGT